MKLVVGERLGWRLSAVATSNSNSYDHFHHQSSYIHHLKMANTDTPDPTNALVPASNRTAEEEPNPVAPAPEPKLPTRKDASLKEFLSKMDDYAPIVSSRSP